MTRVKVDQTLPIDSHYRGLLKGAVKTKGGQMKVAELIDVDQATISRALATGGRATYQTLSRLSQKLNLPDAVVPVRDADHEAWCKLGAVLAEIDHEQFMIALRDLRRDIELAQTRSSASRKPTEEAIDKLKTLITHPLPRGSSKRDRAG